jgi:predicted DNA-binding transcriptional regulator AlpA
MLSIEIRFLSNGREVSLEELADLLATKVNNRMAPLLKPQTPLPQASSHETKVASIRRTTELLGLSRSTIWNLIKYNRLETVHLGRRTLVRMESIRRALDEGIGLNKSNGRKAKTRD